MEGGYITLVDKLEIDKYLRKIKEQLTNDEYELFIKYPDSWKKKYPILQIDKEYENIYYDYIHEYVIPIWNKLWVFLKKAIKHNNDQKNRIILETTSNFLFDRVYVQQIHMNDRTISHIPLPIDPEFDFKKEGQLRYITMIINKIPVIYDYKIDKIILKEFPF